MSLSAVGLELELADLDGTNGFVLRGVASGDKAGASVSAAGDVNGDGIGDLLIGAPGSDTNGPSPGATYVVFGSAGVGSGGVVELSTLNGTNGFVLNGAVTQVSAAGDVNGDGVDDLLIGSSLVDSTRAYAGASHIVFGGAGVGGSGSVELSALDGSNGFVLNGVAANDFSGGSVSAAGDVNGDGVDDLLVGATGADTNGSSSGAAYVVFGGATVGSSGAVELSALNGSNGFVLNGGSLGDLAGNSVSAAGDVNGDGIDDLLIGAWYADPNGYESGASYVVFGGAGVGSGGVIELAALNGSNGFVLNGAAAEEYTGSSVSAAGDVNGDGIDDLLIGAGSADPNGYESGASYVVFGGAGLGNSGVVELAALDGSNGFVLNGAARNDASGSAVSAAGDVNGDGIDDLLIGAALADPNGSRSGASYLVFGGVRGPGATVESATGLSAGCVNLTTGKKVTFPMDSNSVWDCRWRGLAVNDGDNVDMFMRGVATGQGPFRGMTFGFKAGPMLTVCQNTTTGQSVQIQHASGSGWNCEAAGLSLSVNDTVTLLVRGTAK